MISKRRSAVTLMVAMCLFLVACSSPPQSGSDSGKGGTANNGGTSGQTANPKPEGKVVVAVNGGIRYTDPQKNFLSSEASVHYHVFEPLIHRGDDMKLIPWLAESWAANSPTEWVLKLRKGVKFHNGEDFNANVVKWNIDRVLKKGFQDWAFMSVIDHAEVVDDYTIKLVAKAADPTIPALLTQFMIVPQKYIEQNGEAAFNAKPVGTGPYKFVEFVKDQRYVMEANEGWWAGVPKIKTIEWRIMPQAATRLAALKSGEIQIISNLPADQYDVVAADPSLNVIGVRSVRTPLIRFFPDSPQGGGAPLNDKRVRQAINHAVNVDAIIKNLLGGRAERVATLMTPDFPYYDPSVKPYPYDPAKAKQLLTDAGFANGFAINFDVWTDGPQPKPLETIQAICADLGKVQIKCNIHPIDVNAAIQGQNDRKLSPIHAWSWGGAKLDPDDKFWGIFHPDSSANFIKNDAVAKLITDARSTVDEKVRKEIYTKLQQMVVDEALIFPLFVQQDLYGSSKKLSWKVRPDERIFLWNASLK